ncbi:MULTISPECIES: YlxR family protein [unclassified Microcella]|uniref:YlxR family protein n=1 Tax=unclassified Microcella TaxID=2630066 RepID=UPI0009EB03D4|nr:MULTISPECIES: YlxR family protein [unclassified Microcella]
MDPVRTCIGCRRRASRFSLLRVVARDGAVEPDALSRLPGRGAWVHRTRDCVETATARRAWARALRVAGPLDAGPVLTHIGSDGSTREQADRLLDN